MNRAARLCNSLLQVLLKGNKRLALISTFSPSLNIVQQAVAGFDGIERSPSNLTGSSSVLLNQTKTPDRFTPV